MSEHDGFPPEESLQVDVQALRDRYQDTRALYREVCGLLFFRYGVTPTANKLYNLVRKGSMGTPGEVLQEFWKELREKARVKIEHPELPEALKTVAADAVQNVWLAAISAAQHELAALREESLQSVAAAEALRQQAEDDRLRAELALKDCQQALSDTQQLLQAGQENLHTEREAHAATVARLQSARDQLEEHGHQLEEIRRQFAADLEHARKQVDLAQTRETENTRRILLDLDAERTARQRSEALLDSLRAELSAVQQLRQDEAVRHADRAGQLQGELQGLKLKLEEVMGRYEALTAELDRLSLAQAAAQRRAEQAELEVSLSRKLLTEIKLHEPKNHNPEPPTD